MTLALLRPQHLPVARYDMLGLVESFPSLRNADHFRLVDHRELGSVERGKRAAFDANRLNRWVRTDPGVTAGSLMAGRFVLQVWNPHTKWTAGRFNVVEALQRWDERHRAAFLAWAADPWWP